MKIGIFIQSNLNTGGEFYNSINFVNKIKKTKNKNILIFTNNKKTYYDLKKYNIKSKIVKYSLVDNLIFKVFNYINLIDIIPYVSSFEKKIINEKIDLLIFTSVYRKLSFLKKINFAFIILDLAHLYYKNFIELDSKESQLREKIIRKNIIKAKIIFVEDLSVKNILQKNYGYNKKIICINKYENAPFLTKKNNHKKIKTFKNFLFYPSSFWQHKNHTLIIKTLHRLKMNKIIFNAVFVGADKGYKSDLLKLTSNLKISNQIQFFDRLDDHRIIELYKRCDAVLYPSFFGPANLPVAESWKFNKALIYPSIYKDYINKAAITFNNNSINSLSKALATLKNKTLTTKIIKRGRQELKKIKLDNLNQIKAAISAVEKIYY